MFKFFINAEWSRIHSFASFLHSVRLSHASDNDFFAVTQEKAAVGPIHVNFALIALLGVFIEPLASASL